MRLELNVGINLVDCTSVSANRIVFTRIVAER